jgi:hypothetical protein
MGYIVLLLFLASTISLPTVVLRCEIDYRSAFSMYRI